MNVDEIVKDVLEHHGIKGMKWGIRRKATVGPHEVVVRDSRRTKAPTGVTVKDKSKKLKTSGGKGHPATESAIQARVIGQKAKKSGVKSLTDEELRAYANRIQLEQNVSRLQYNEKSRGAKFVDGFLGRQGSQLANKAAREGGTKAGKIGLGYAIKKSAKVAAVAAA